MHSVVSDSTPLIHLAKLNLLWILKDLYTEVFIPRIVYIEIIEEGKYLDKKDADIIETFIENFIFVKEVDKGLKEDISKKYSIHPGESETIALCKVLNLSVILIDESKGRKVAEKEGLKPVGTIGIVLKSFNKGIINYEETKSALTRMMLETKEFYFSPEIIGKAILELELRK